MVKLIGDCISYLTSVVGSSVKVNTWLLRRSNTLHAQLPRGVLHSDPAPLAVESVEWRELHSDSGNCSHHTQKRVTCYSYLQGSTSSHTYPFSRELFANKIANLVLFLRRDNLFVWTLRKTIQIILITSSRNEVNKLCNIINYYYCNYIYILLACIRAHLVSIVLPLLLYDGLHFVLWQRQTRHSVQ